MVIGSDDLKVLEAKNLQLGVLDGPVDAERSEPVHLRRRLPLVTEVPRSLQLNVYPATRGSFRKQVFLKNVVKLFCSSLLVGRSA